MTSDAPFIIRIQKFKSNFSNGHIDCEMELHKLEMRIQKQNGRVVNVTENPKPRMPMYEPPKEEFESFKSRAIFGILQPTPVSDAFFSPANEQRVQNLIRWKVWKESDGKYTIGEQDDTELKVVMRSYYLQQGQNNPAISVREQVNRLNAIVISYAVPNVISKVKQYNGYIQSVESLPVPIPLPTNVSSAGTRLLPSVTTTF